MRCFVLHTSGESELLQVAQPIRARIRIRQMNIFMGTDPANGLRLRDYSGAARLAPPGLRDYSALRASPLRG